MLLLHVYACVTGRRKGGVDGRKGEIPADCAVPFKGQKWMVYFIFPPSIFLSQMSKLKNLLCVYIIYIR